MSFLHPAGLLACGGAAGLVGALLGLGGGIFLIPALVLLYGLPMRAAAGIGLVAVVATSSAAASVNVGRGLANMRLGIVLEPATVGGALLGASLAGLLSSSLLVGLFAILLFANSLLLWKGPRGGPEDLAPLKARDPLGGEYHDPASGRSVSYSVERLPWVAVVSFAAGIFSALLGVGGGILKVPALHLLGRVPMKAAAATSNLMIGATAGAGAAVYLARGDVPVEFAGTVTLGVLGGSMLGLKVSRRLSDRAVRRVFAALTLLIGIQMLRRALGR
ncbi:MAG: sulfite exporter TauE/SafE family protein [Elusimicrobiota bacterium]|jgi:hypothetical protein